MASIQALKNKDGKITSYRITVSQGYDHGEKIRKTTTYKPKETAPTKRQKELETFALEFEKAVRAGAAGLSGDKILFKDFVKVWEEKKLSKDVLLNKITIGSKEGYIKIMNNHVIPYLGKIKLTNIRTEQIDDLVLQLLEKGKSVNTIRNIFNTLHACLDYAFRKDYIPVNPCLKCDPLPKVEKRKELHTFTEEQAQRFLDALSMEYETDLGGRSHHTEKRPIPLQHKVFFTLALLTGCRRGELVALDWTDVDSVNKTIRIDQTISRSDEKGLYLKDPKTKSGNRIIKLPGYCFDLLNQWKEEQKKICDNLGSAWVGYRGKEYDNNPVFIQTDSGKRMHVETPSHKFTKILEAYNNSVSEEDQLPIIRLHDLRHTNASILIFNGVDGEETAQNLGHSKPSFTLDVYAHPLNKVSDKAARVMEEKFKVAL